MEEIGDAGYANIPAPDQHSICEKDMMLVPVWVPREDVPVSVSREDGLEQLPHIVQEAVIEEPGCLPIR